MAIENLPVWSFEPNWSSTVTETLEWLTDVMTSPSGSEQRRTLRYLPRRFYEFTTMLVDAERRFFDNLLIRSGSARWYMPLWQDTNVITADRPLGSAFIPTDYSTSSKIIADMLRT
jgi:hypothetical protein